jgi:hypothetical protein
MVTFRPCHPWPAADLARGVRVSPKAGLPAAAIRRILAAACQIWLALG